MASAISAFGADLAGPDTGARNVRDAIVQALERRMGPGVTFDVSDIVASLAAPIDGPLAVSFDSSARLGGNIRFSISTRSRRQRARVTPIGEGTAVVHGNGPAVRALRNLIHGGVVESSDIAVETGDLGAVLIRRLPTLEEATSARVLRDLGTGDVIVDTAIVGVPSVRSGDRVRVVVREPGIELASVAIAVQSGAANQVIEVVNPDTRQMRRARITGKGEVEVIHGR